MEPNKSENQQELGFSYYRQPPTTATTSTTTINTTLASPTNGLHPPNDGGAHMVYSHSVPPSAVTAPLENTRRKRGRPRKYGTPEQALAAKKTASSSNNSAARERKEQQQVLASSAFHSGNSKKSQSGNSGKGFTPHVILVAAGEDVGQKILSYIQDSNRDICILSASGSISNVSLLQRAASGGNITYEGRFELISLCGSYVRTEHGRRSGGLSVCLNDPEGNMIGGGIGGPLKAAGLVQVIVGTFSLDSKKDANGGSKIDAAGSGLQSPVGVAASMANVVYRPGLENIGGRNSVGGNEEHQAMGGGHFMFQSRGMQHMPHSRPVEWGGSPDARSSASYDMTGRGGHQSPENGDYDHIPD